MEKLKFATICALTLNLLLGGLGCAKNDSGGSSAPAAPVCQAGYTMVNGTCLPSNQLGGGICPVGSFQSQYGCVQQGHCPTGQALVNGNCTYVGNNGNSCPVGHVSTYYGCLPQGSCPAGYALYNNQCAYFGYSNTSCPPGTVMSGGQCLAANSAGLNSCQGICGAGQVQTNRGCLPQHNSCGSCYGYYQDGNGRYCMGGSEVGYAWRWLGN